MARVQVGASVTPGNWSTSEDGRTRAVFSDDRSLFGRPDRQLTSIEGCRTSSSTSAEHGRIAEDVWFRKVLYLPCTTYSLALRWSNKHSHRYSYLYSQINNVANIQASGRPLNMKDQRVTPRRNAVPTLALMWQRRVRLSYHKEGRRTRPQQYTANRLYP